VLSSAV